MFEHQDERESDTTTPQFKEHGSILQYSLIVIADSTYLRVILVPVLHLLHGSPRGVLVVLTLRLLLVQVVRTLLAAVALPPHGGGAVGHAPVLVSVGGRPRVQPEMNCQL